MSATAWRARGACRGRDPFRWFSGYAADIEAARGICMSCPVRSVCLCSQLEYEEQVGHVTDGMFGGRTPADRKVLLRHRGATA